MIYMVEDMTVAEAIKRIKEFALHHAIQELPNSTRTVEAFEMAVDALQIVSKIVRCGECKYWWKENELCSHPRHCDGRIVCVHECDRMSFCSDGERKDGEG